MNLRCHTYLGSFLSKYSLAHEMLNFSMLAAALCTSIPQLSTKNWVNQGGHLECQLKWGIQFEG